MVHSYGYKSGTRHLFQQKFRQHGVPGVRDILTSYRVGDYVDVVADPSVRKGMPHKFYHGRTGIVWNVTPRGVGVIVNKVVRNKTLRKRICVRFEHVKKSRCRKAFLEKLGAYRNMIKAKKEGKALPKKPCVRRARLVRHPKVKKIVCAHEEFDQLLKY